MGRSQNSFMKKLKAEKKRKKKQEKFDKKMEKKNKPVSGKLEDMLAYVDENGNISSEPADDTENDKSEISNNTINNNNNEKRNS